ncbi:MAG TPA: hypothetical protein VIK64_18835 [Anaerolineales bacterium]|jgi:hypothetical protein
MQRSRTVTVFAWLLLFQALGLSIISALNFSSINFEWQITHQDFYMDLPSGLRGWAFATLSLLALLTGVRFFRLRESAWLHAMLIQGLNLSLAIGLYLQQKPFYVYPLMVYCIFMVLYLNYSDVLNTFGSEEALKEWGGIDEP